MKRRTPNKTNYRNQINKVANAIKEIIAGLKTGPVGSNCEKIQLKVDKKEVDRRKKRIRKA